MLKGRYEHRVEAPQREVWRVLKQALDDPARFYQGVSDVQVIERDRDGLVRELTLMGHGRFREEISIDRPNFSIRYGLTEHPHFTGFIRHTAVNRHGDHWIVMEAEWDTRPGTDPLYAPDVAGMMQDAGTRALKLAEDTTRWKTERAADAAEEEREMDV